MSREAVLNEIHRYMEERDYTIGLLDDNVCGLPPVTPKQPGWIPTSERLPEDNEEVLFCDNEGERWLGWHYGFWKTERLDFNEDEVVAWMPLPKPWEGDTDAH